MKKLLIVLMVLAMSSFLFVGCLPTAPEVPEVPEVPEEEVVVPATTAPIITSIDGGGVSLTSTATQYINGTGATFAVDGVGPTNAIIKIYVNDVYVGTDSTGWTGTFTTVVINKANLKDGEKTIYATATEPGLAESVPSTSYKFTLDTVAPKVKTSGFGISAATLGGLPADRGYIEVTFDEDVKASTITVTTWVNTPVLGGGYIATVKSATVAKITEVAAGDLAAGAAFRVDCPATITDLAGNALDAVFNFALGTIL